MSLNNFKYNLKSLKKCDQYWNEMDAIPGGRLCAKCEKKIIDFSGMSFSEIAVFMSESNEPVCGFYLPEQLKEIKTCSAKFPIAVGLSTLIATTTFADHVTPRQEPIENSIDERSPGNIVSNNGVPVIDLKADTFYISGRIEYFDTVKNKSLPVAFAVVTVKGSNHGTTSDDMGNFKLYHQTKGTISIRVSSVGFETYEVTGIELKDKTEIDLGTINMIMLKVEMSEFYVTLKKRSRLSKFWRRITKPFR